MTGESDVLSLLLGHASPHTKLFWLVERIVETVPADLASKTNGCRIGFLFLIKEHLWIIVTTKC